MRSILLALILGLGVAGCEQQPEQPAGQSAEVKGADRQSAGTAAPTTTFKDADGEDISIAELKGTPVLVNLWATWCAPCVKELPTLDRLAQQSGAKLRVVTISQDNAPQGSVSAFLEKLGTAELAPYHDPDMAMSGALNIQILPTSVLYDSQGREVWRYVGDLDWTSAEARKLLAEAR